jgi:hypothetical protein
MHSYGSFRIFKEKDKSGKILKEIFFFMFSKKQKKAAKLWKDFWLQGGRSMMLFFGAECHGNIRDI